MRIIVVVASVFVASLASPAIAYDKLPKTAKPIPAAELTNAYAGKTVKWNDGLMYWGTDGKVIGVTPKGDAIADGTWDAVNGKVCYHASWIGFKPTDKPYPLNNCFGYMVAGKHVYRQFASDKMKSDTGWWGGPSDLEALKAGNTIQAKYEAVKAKIPKKL